MRAPNPWVVVPVGIAAAGGATVGYFVTTASCAPRGCVVSAIAVAVGAALVASAGVGIVVILAFRSIAEFRDGPDRDILTFADEDEPAPAVPGVAASVPTIAEAGPSDADDISRFLWAAWHEAGAEALGWTGASEEVMKDLTRRDAILDRLGGPTRRMFIARTPDGIVGLAATRHGEGDEGELAGVIVLQGMVGRGIGTPLVELAVAALASDGCSRVVVTTEQANDRALRFYRSRGFEEVSRRAEEVEGAVVDTVELERRL
jgi:ribosomal protein S18 acetylase RimI-like enzyme